MTRTDFQNQQSKNLDNNSIQSPKSPHFWWIISILLVIIIGLVSFIILKQVVNSDEIINYVSFASVLLSITLSVFAIQYTYTSNSQIQQQFEKINIAANEINRVSEKLINVSTRLEENIDDIVKKLGAIDADQKYIKSRFNNSNQELPSLTNISQENL